MQRLIGDIRQPRGSCRAVTAFLGGSEVLADLDAMLGGTIPLCSAAKSIDPNQLPNLGRGSQNAPPEGELSRSD